MFLSGISVFFIWWVKATEDVVVILGCLFNAISIAGWNALNVLNAQSYPTELRSVEIVFNINALHGSYNPTVKYISVNTPEMTLSTLIHT